MSYLTWNQQGRHVTAEILNQQFKGIAGRFDPDYICLQEVGNHGWGGGLKKLAAKPAWVPKTGSLYQITNQNLNGEAYEGFYLQWLGPGAGNVRCSTAVLYRASLLAHTVGGWWNKSPFHRPVIWLIPPAAGKPLIGCVHAPSGGNSPYVQGALKAMIAAAGKSKWRLIGDFNIRFPTLQKRQPHWPAPLPGLPTQSCGEETQQAGGDIDYSIGTLPNTPNCVPAEYYKSDHRAVAFW